MPEQTRLTTETQQAIAAGMPPCPNCGGRNVRPSVAVRFEDKLRGMFHFWPYRCRACQNRFYSRPKPPAVTGNADRAQAG
jgi:hypothetical protein